MASIFDEEKALTEANERADLRTQTRDSLWWGHRTAPLPTAQQVSDVVNTPLSQYGPGPLKDNASFGTLSPAAPASMREQTEAALRPYTGYNASQGLTGSESGIGVADFVPGLGTPTAVADFLDTRNKVATGEAGALDYGLSGAGIVLSALPGGVAAKKILQKGVKYSSKLMDEVLAKAKNVTSKTEFKPAGTVSLYDPEITDDIRPLYGRDSGMDMPPAYTPFTPEKADRVQKEFAADNIPLYRSTDVDNVETIMADPISKGQIKSEIVNKGDVTKQDRALMERALAKVEGDKVNPRDLAKAVDEETFPLNTTNTSHYADYDTSGRAKEAGGKFDTVIYRGNLYHGTENHFNDPYYFAHTRRQDLTSISENDVEIVKNPNGFYSLHVRGDTANPIVDPTTDQALTGFSLDEANDVRKGLIAELKQYDTTDGVRRILEIQSDALQKRGNVQEILKNRHGNTEDIDGKIEQFNRYIPDIEELKGALQDPSYTLNAHDKDFLRFMARKLGTTVDGLDATKAVEHISTSLDGRLAELANMQETAGKATGLTDADRMLEYQNLWQYRVAREELKQAAKDGKKEVWFPTGPTASRIENWDDVNNKIPRTEAEIRDWAANNPFNTEPGVPQGWGAVGNSDKPPVGKMLSDPEVHDLISRKGNPYKNEIEYARASIQDNTRMIKEEEDYIKQLGDVPDNLRSAQEQRLIVTYQASINHRKETIEQNKKLLAELEGKGDTKVPESKYYGLYNMYQDLGKWLKGNFKAEPVTDSNGLSWLKVKINPEQADEPVRAFKSVAAIPAGMMADQQGITNEDGELGTGTALGAAVAGAGAVKAVRGIPGGGMKSVKDRAIIPRISSAEGSGTEVTGAMEFHKKAEDLGQYKNANRNREIRRSEQQEEAAYNAAVATQKSKEAEKKKLIKRRGENE